MTGFEFDAELTELFTLPLPLLKLFSASVDSFGAHRLSLTKYFGDCFSRVSLTKHGRKNMTNCM